MTASDWGTDGPAQDPVPGDTAAQGATNPPNPPEDATASGNDGSGDLSGSSMWAAIQALAALLEPEAFDPNVKAVPEWREPTKAVAVNHAAKVITSGYRLVSEDEATVDRVARALWRDAVADIHMPDTEANWAAASVNGAFQSAARAAVRALREADTDG